MTRGKKITIKKMIKVDIKIKFEGVRFKKKRFFNLI